MRLRASHIGRPESLRISPRTLSFSFAINSTRASRCSADPTFGIIFEPNRFHNSVLRSGTLGPE